MKSQNIILLLAAALIAILAYSVIKTEEHRAWGRARGLLSK
jgi:hypothetical protein